MIKESLWVRAKKVLDDDMNKHNMIVSLKTVLYDVLLQVVQLVVMFNLVIIYIHSIESLPDNIKIPLLILLLITFIKWPFYRPTLRYYRDD